MWLFEVLFQHKRKNWNCGKNRKNCINIHKHTKTQKNTYELTQNEFLFSLVVCFLFSEIN